jgi:hypothetical protein
MKCRVLGALLLAMGVAAGVAAQEECPTGKPKVLVPAISPVVGQSPMWATAGSTASNAEWESADKPVGVMWVRDLAVVGPAVLTGSLKGKPDQRVLFAERGSTLGVKNPKFALTGLGLKPSKATLADVQKYGFYQADVWFPSTGCYEIQARVGKTDSTIYLNVETKKETAKPAPKAGAKPAPTAKPAAKPAPKG